MSQVLEKPALPAKPVDGTLASIILYIFLVLVPIGLKLDGITRVATWSWWRVTAVLWIPWGLLVLVSVIGWLWYLATHRRG